MTDALSERISVLEAQRAAIDAELARLRAKQSGQTAQGVVVGGSVGKNSGACVAYGEFIGGTRKK